MLYQPAAPLSGDDDGGTGSLSNNSTTKSIADNVPEEQPEDVPQDVSEEGKDHSVFQRRKNELIHALYNHARASKRNRQ
ncbi:hypothetical protein QFC19_004965 [Naganishia cerealis]|uniref:Uncharacterized protein n=1 Tax=Naganishia cerealis TaxID=610337 RepID=A0ACC2VRS3_9TREE|nr:hypothetical protein QFC19_004965 [Naganishia cerealis]